jgi:outer membrane immunogenic protein
MRKILAASIGILALAAAIQPAAAADMPIKAPRIVVDPWNWTGVYVGLNAGYSWGRSDTHINYFNSVTGAAILPPPGAVTDAKFNLNGGIAGGQIGVNWQVNKDWLVGVEADVQWSGQRGSADFSCPIVAIGVGACFPGVTFFPPGTPGASLSFDQKLTWFATARVRTGVLFTPTVFGYLTAGLAYGEIETSGVLSSTTILLVPVNTAFNHSADRFGWTVGAGFEGRLWGNWTGKIEYLFMDLGSVSGSIIPVGGAPLGLLAANYSSRITDNILRIGINYKFGPDPVVAKN